MRLSATWPQRFGPYIILLLLAVAGYSPLTSGLFSLKNDDIAYFLPYRFNVVENLRNGFLPLWSPYVYQGFPLAGDMQSGAWNPIVWLLALFGRYDHTSLSIEIITYIFLAGTGMFRLLKELNTDRNSAVALAAAYMFCGFLLDSGQILCWVACAAILPFTYLYLARILHNPNARNAVLFALANCMLIAAGYPAFFIINIYVYAFIILTQAAGKTFIQLRAPLIWLSVSALLFLVTGALMCCSIYEMLPFYRRGGSIGLEGVLEDSYHSSFSLSAIFPLATTWGKPPFKAAPDIFGNMYFGILLIPFFLRGLWHKRSHFINSIAILSLLCFLLSLGREFPLRKFAFNYLPLMNTFRHPANFRVFVIIGCLLIVARGITEYLKDSSARKKPVLGMFQLALAGLVTTTAIFLFKSHNLFRLETVAGNTSALKALTLRPGFFSQALAVNALIQSLFILAAWMLLRAGRINGFFRLHVLNLLLTALPLVFYGWVSSGSATALNKRIQAVPDGFPVTELNLPVSKYRNAEVYNYGLFRNLGSFYARRPLINGSFTSPTTLTAYYWFLRDSALVKSLASYPAVNFGDSTIRGNPRMLLTRTASKPPINIEVFDPSTIRFNVNSVTAGICWVFQNAYPGWTVEVDGKPETLETINHCFIGVAIEPGRHEVVFSFKPKWLNAAMVFSIAGLLLSAWFLLRPSKIRTANH